MRWKEVLRASALMSMGMQPLLATVNVTNSNDSGAGSLREAVQTVNTGGTPPISFLAGANPTLSTNMLGSTVSASLEVADSPTVHTITGNGNVALNIQGVGVVLSVAQEIQFASSQLLINEGTLQFNGANNLVGVTAIELSGVAPILQFSGAATGTFAPNFNLVGTTDILKVDPSLTITLTGTITGTVLEKQGTGTLVLPGPNIYVGGTTHTAGTLEVGNNTSMGSGPVTMKTGTTIVFDPGLSIGNAFVLNGLPQTFSVPSGTVILSGTMSGAGSLVISGGGVLELLGTSTYTGSTTISSGTLRLIGANSSIAHSSAVSISAGATFDLSSATVAVSFNNLSGAGNLVLGTESVTITQTNAGIFSGIISGSGSVTLGSGSTNTLTLAGVNLYTGATTIQGGTLALAGGGSIAASSSVTVNGSLDISGTTVGATVHNLSGTGSVILGGKTLTVVEQSGGTLSGVISGGLGSLVIDATSTHFLTLSAVNTYTGPTLIYGGGIALSGSGSIESSSAVLVNGVLDIHAITSQTKIANLSGSGTIALGAKTLTVVQTAPGTFSGVIGGVGGNFILGALSTSQLTLSAVNTYTGVTKIEAGTLILTGDGSIALSSEVTVDGILDVSGVTTGTLVQNLRGGGSILLGSKSLTVVQTESGIFSGVISGAGGSLSLDVSSSSILALTNVNTYTGSTKIFGGILSLVGPGSIASSDEIVINGVLDISNSAAGADVQNISGQGYIVLGTRTLTVHQNVSGEFSGMILGTLGGIVKEGTATLSLTGANSYGGVTTIAAGTLIGNASSLPSSIVNLGALVFNQSGTGTYANVISGTGSVTKTGTGTLTLSQASTYTGVTTVDQGTLVVNGSIISSSTTVGVGGNLQGTGSVGPLDVYGIVQPGSSIGTLTVEGSATLETGSTLALVVNNKGFSQLDVTGSVTLEGGVQCLLKPQSGFLDFVQAPLLVLDSASRTGEFSSIVCTMPRTEGILHYQGSQVFLTIEVQPLASLGFQGNSQHVAEALDAVLDSGNQALNGVIESLLPLTDEQIDSALNVMHPALYRSMTLVQQSDAVHVRQAVNVRMQNVLDLTCCGGKQQPQHIWIQGWGDNLFQPSETYAQSPQFAYQASTGGGALGWDGSFLSHFYTGALVGYTSSQIEWLERKGKGSLQTGYAGLYASFLSTYFYSTASVLGGWSWFDEQRHIRYPGVSRVASSCHGGSQLLSHLDAGVNLKAGCVTVRPFDSLDYVVQNEEGFVEKQGGSYDLRVKKNHATLLRNELGLQIAYCLQGWQSKWTFSPQCSWVREIRLHGSDVHAKFDHTDEVFTVVGYFPSRNLIVPGFTLAGTLWDDLVCMDLYYMGTFGSGYADHSYGGQIRFGF